MSRIGNQPVNIPDGVSVSWESSLVKVKGPKGELSQKVDNEFDVKIEDGELTVSRPLNRRGIRHCMVYTVRWSLIW